MPREIERGAELAGESVHLASGVLRRFRGGIAQGSGESGRFFEEFRGEGGAGVGEQLAGNRAEHVRGEREETIEGGRDQ